MTQVIKDVVTWLKQWFYTESEVDTLLGGKVSTAQGSSNASKNVVTDSGGNITVEAKPTIPSASSTTPSADTTSGAVGTGTTWARADHKHPKSSLYAEATHTHTKSNITDFSHTHSVTDVTDSNAHSHIGTSANATQGAINTAIDSKLSELVDINFVTVVQTLPTASQSTMGKIYLVPSDSTDTNDNYEEYVTIKDGNTYSWEKFGEITDISVAWNDITGKPSTFTPSSHTHGNITNDGKVGSDADYFVITGTGGAVTSQKRIGKISTDGKLYTDTSAGVTLNNAVLMTSSTGSIIGGSSLNANKVTDVNAHSNIGTDGSTHQETINTAIDTAIGGKSDKTATIGTTITLVDKGETNEGCIIFNTIS